jgi:uncharacterized protein (TIGR01777 family)
MSEKQPLKIIPEGLSVLITGGSGLIGKYLTSLLISEGYKVSHLSRNASKSGIVKIFHWDPENQILAPEALENIDCILHLAGSNIGEKRWTKKRKKEIVKSRIDSTNLLFKTIMERNIQLKVFISASAAGYYGSFTSDKIYSETDPPSTDFLGTTCRLWEEAADQFTEHGTRVVKIRTAVVLEKTDSALSKIMMPARFGFLVQTGTGRQYMPWIHIRDLCSIYLKAIEDENMNGAFNAVSPQHVTHKKFLETLARVMQKFLFQIPVPAFVIRTALGEMSDVILKGSRISSAILESSGYEFIFPDLEDCLRDILKIE